MQEYIYQTNYKKIKFRELNDSINIVLSANVEKCGLEKTQSISRSISIMSVVKPFSKMFRIL